MTNLINGVDFDQIPGIISSSDASSNLQILLATREKLRIKKAQDISFSGPILRQGENAIIYPRTITVIQGQTGVHKSRLAATICSAFLKLPGCETDLLGFNQNGCSDLHTILYVDTERNLDEQLPYALQQIQLKAGYEKEDHPENFQYLSLLQIARAERFTALNECLAFTRRSTLKPLFIVLDVTTDCISNFNDPVDSLQLIDMLNMAISEHNVTFLCIIHENPGTNTKARGHLGTEISNKASTVIQVGFKKDSENVDTDLLEVKYLKCRQSERYPSFYVKYSKEASGLIMAETDDVASLVKPKTKNLEPSEMPKDLHLKILKKAFEQNPKQNRAELLGQIKLAFGINQLSMGESRIKGFFMYYENEKWIKQEGTVGTRSSFYTLVTELV